MGALRMNDTDVPRRIARSIRANEGVMSLAEFHRWFAERRRRHRVASVPLDDLAGWGFDPGTGDLCHETGRFFTVSGLRVATDFGPVRRWEQPIINQPEIGIIGVVVRAFDGVPHFLMQAKFEPGNTGGVQLTTTVQATKSNYTRVHGGSAVPYLDWFRTPEARRSGVFADVLQSEQGSWFYRKRNRNMIVEADTDVTAGEDFCWLTLGQLHRLMHVDNLVSMDARTVISCIPFGPGALAGATDGGRLSEAIVRSADPAAGSLHTQAEILGWITGRQTVQELATKLIPLRDVRGWSRDAWSIAHERGLHFSIVGVDVASESREVTRWSQPLLRPHGTGVIALLVRRFHGVLHVLVNARVEPGFLDVVELAPTVQATPRNYAHLPPESLPPFLDIVQDVSPEEILFEAEFSEEGGRLDQARSRYMIIETDAQLPPRPDFRWLALHQLTDLLQHSHYVNMQARTLIACLRTLA